MRKYLAIFSYQTLVVIAITLLSCFLSVTFGLRVYADFLIVGVIIVFPLTFTMREAFKRRERSIQYLSQLKASLQSVVYTLQVMKIEGIKKLEVHDISANIIDTLIDYLTNRTDDATTVQEASAALGKFINDNRKQTRSVSFKLFSFVLRVNDSIEYLLAVRRHRTPWGPRVIVLVAIYVFAIFYPAAILFKLDTEVQVWNLFLMSVFKILILISLYNVQRMMENPFNQNSPDGIRLDDFRLSTAKTSSMETKPPSLLNNTFNHDKIISN